MQVDFCLPVYNEEKILKTNVLRLLSYCQEQNFGFGWQVIIIVNGSNDNSFAIAKELSKKYQQIKTLNIKSPGRGQALKKHWSQTKAAIIAYMDIDLAVSLNNIPDLINPIVNNQADLVMGSRLLAESKIERSFVRELSSQTYNFLSRLILGHHFSDLQCGFKAIKAPVFKQILPYLKNDYWFFDTELIYFAYKLGYQVKEIPVNWSENRYDQRKSKVNLFTDSSKFIIELIKLKKRYGHFKPNGPKKEN